MLLYSSMKLRNSIQTGPFRGSQRLGGKKDPSSSSLVRFAIQEEGAKEALEHFKHVIKIFSNIGHIFQNKLRNTLTAILNLLTLVPQHI